MKKISFVAIFLLFVIEARALIIFEETHEPEKAIKETDVPKEKEVDLTDEGFENAKKFHIEDYKYDKNKPYPLLNDIIRDSSEPMTAYAKTDVPKEKEAHLTNKNYAIVNKYHLNDNIRSPIKPTTDYAKKAVVSNRSRLWPNAIVPYKLNWTWLKHEKVILAKAIKFFNAVTCVKWVPWTNEADYVFFDVSMNCSSFLGRVGGKQKLSLHPENCISLSIILHQMMHAIGFEHEHNRPDRDKYVDIRWKNIMPDNETRSNFEIEPTIVSLGPYDYNSITHYPRYAGSANGLSTIRAVNRLGIIGPKGTLTQLDIQKISQLYQCNQTKPKKKPNNYKL